MTLPAVDFVDVSSNNSHPINWSAVKAAGVKAVAIKATEGVNYINPFYNGPDGYDVRDAEAAGLAVMAYHFAGWSDVGAELAHFLSVAGPRARCLDGETTVDDPWINAFLAGLPGAHNQKCLYGTHYYLGKGYGALIWVASYGVDFGGDAWQWTSTDNCPGISGSVDASCWQGAPSDFSALFSTVAPVPPPVPTSKARPKLFCTDPKTGGTWSTDGDGELFAEFGAPFIQGLNQHPDYRAGGTESGGKNPCVGITPFLDKNSEWGICYFTFDWVKDPDGSPYHKYRFARDGSPD